jgi:hypothetical protein
MGRPAIVKFESFTDTVAIDGAVSILNTDKKTTITGMIDRFRKRVDVEQADEDLFVARVRAALCTLANQGKITITDETVAVVPGKRGRPAGSKKVVAAESATSA